MAEAVKWDCQQEKNAGASKQQDKDGDIVIQDHQDSSANQDQQVVSNSVVSWCLFFRLTLDMIWYECLCCAYYTTLNKLCKVHSTEYSSSHVHNTEILFVHVCALHYPERFWDSSSFQETPTSQAKQVEKKLEPSTVNQGHQSVTSPLVSLLQIYSWDELNKILGERNLIKRRDFLNILYLSRNLQKSRGRKIQAQLVALHVNWRLMDMSALRIIKTTKLVQPHL